MTEQWRTWTRLLEQIGALTVLIAMPESSQEDRDALTLSRGTLVERALAMRAAMGQAIEMRQAA